MSSSLNPPAVSIYIIRLTSDGPRYLTIRRCCGGYLNGTWQMVTGGVEEKETATQAALREVWEETGLVPTKLYTGDALESFYLHHQNKILFVPVFVAFVDEANVRLCPEEHDQYEWLSFEKAREKFVWAEQKRLIAYIHERFALQTPPDILLLDTQQKAPLEPPISRTGVYGIAMQNNKILLVQQKSGPHLGKLDLPGGKIEPGETIEEALRREFQEETGLTFSSLEPLDHFTALSRGIDENGRSYSLHQIGLIYRVENLSSLPNATPQMQCHWADPNLLTEETLAPFALQALRGCSVKNPSLQR